MIADLAAPAELARLESLAAEIEAARRRHPPGGGSALDVEGLRTASRAVTSVLARRGIVSNALHECLSEVDLAALVEWGIGRSDETPTEGAVAAWPVVRLALPPFLRAVPPRAAGADRCPTCGSMPDLATIEPDGARMLVCASCDTAWRFDRIACPFCGNAAQDRLGYLAGSSAGASIRVCDACRSYLKTIDRRRWRMDASALLRRLLTAEMDAAAVGAGYRSASR